jgi:hypothetical protein
MNETLQDLLSVADPLPAAALSDLPARLRDARAASLFTLSRQAQSSEVRAEAAKALSARLREDHPVAADEKSPQADAIARGELPPELATARHFYKFSDEDQWVLTTRSGVKVASFASEADLDRWWRGLRRQRGRILTRVRKGEA